MKVTEEEYANWLTPLAAANLLSAGLGGDDYAAKKTLLDALEANVLASVAKKSSWGNGNRQSEYEEIPAEEWGRVDTGSLLWNSGHVTYSVRRDRTSDYVEVRRFNVRFEPNGVNSLLPPHDENRKSKRVRTRADRNVDLVFADDGVMAPTAAQTLPRPSSTPPVQLNRGGRPKKDFWDEFWIDICHQIYIGDLNPKTQAELQNAMHQWVVDHGQDAGETVIKAAAKKLFIAWKLGVGK